MGQTIKLPNSVLAKFSNVLHVQYADTTVLLNLTFTYYKIMVVSTVLQTQHSQAEGSMVPLSQTTMVFLLSSWAISKNVDSSWRIVLRMFLWKPSAWTLLTSAHTTPPLQPNGCALVTSKYSIQMNRTRPRLTCSIIKLYYIVWVGTILIAGNEILVRGRGQILVAF